MTKSNDIVINIRKIIRAIDLHSNQLVQKYNMTGPQITLCNALIEDQKLTVTELSEKVHLSKATVVSILDRLCAKEFVRRQKDTADKRKVFIFPTQKLIDLYSKAPPNLLQEVFINRFEQLKEWEQSLILSSFERVAEMMHAEKIDASPIFYAKSEI